MEAANYYLSDDIPEIFKIADRVVYQRNEDPNKEEEKNDKILKMPKRKNNKRFHDKKSSRESIDRRDPDEIRKPTVNEMKEAMVELLYERDKLNCKLKRLNPNNKKGFKKSVKIANQIREIDDQLRFFSDESNVSVSSLENETKVDRFKTRVKYRIGYRIKKIKKFVKQNMEGLTSIISIAVPVIGGLFLKGFLKL